MSERSFFDSNVLVYTDDRDAPAKRALAIALVERGIHEGWATISTQVLQEYFVITTRKLGVEPRIARDKVEVFARMPLMTNGAEDILHAIDVQRLQQVSFWDALIIHAALKARCSVLFTEDLQHGQRFQGLEIVNPFR